MSRLGDAALAYLKQGRSVVPVAPGKKYPPLLKWEPYQSKLPTEAEVAGWWEETPDANIALITGRISGISVIDFDGDEGKQSFVHDLQGAVPKTLFHHTPRGAHVIVEYEPDLKQTAGALPGVDIRNDGGYIIAPPSVVNGKEYTVHKDRPIIPFASIPPVLNGRKPQPAPTDRPTWVAEALQGVSEPQRNDTAARLIGYFHKKGIPRDIIEAQMAAFAERCAPPMSPIELRRTIDSVTRYQQRVAEEQITDPPVFRQEGEDYLFNWEPHLIQVRLSEAWHQKDGLHARIDITSTAPGMPPNLLRTVNWNLHSTSGREGLVRYLNKRLPLDWASILEDTARLTVRTYEEGEPSVILSQVVPEESGFLMSPLLREGEPTVLFGDGGSGKSYLALAAAMSVHSGDSLLPFNVIKPQPVLYLDWESSATTHRLRMERLALGMDPIIDSLPDIVYLRCTLSLSDHLRQIKALISKHAIGVGVIDSAAAAAGGEPEKAEIALRFFNALRALKLTSLIVAHTTKEDANKALSHKPFGSAFWHNEARGTFEVVRAQDEDSSDIDIGVYHRKANDSMLVKPIGLQLRFTKSTTWFERLDLDHAAPKLAEGLSDAGKIRRYLQEIPRASVKDIADNTGIIPDTVRRTLNRHKSTFNKIFDGSNEWSNTPGA